ncbi:MAG: laccase domain-containing protein, partial [Ramlibacter sp.]
MPLPQGWIAPEWPLPPNVRAVCTIRAGGHSAAPYDSLNLGGHVGDAPEAVAANRALLAQAIAARPVFLNQVHGQATALVTGGAPDGTTADACITTTSGIACTIMV